LSPLKSQTKTRAKNIVDLLRSMGFKASTPREGDLCLESYLECCGQVLRLVFFDGRYTDDLVARLHLRWEGVRTRSTRQKVFT